MGDAVSNDIGIYITSAGRANKINTLKYMSLRMQEFITFVVPYEEYEEYDRALCQTKCRLIAPPSGISLMSPKRQWAIEHAPERFFWMMDDDLDFMVRTPHMRLVPATQDDVEHMFQETVLTTLISGMPFVGISSRYGNNLVTDDYKDIGRVSRCWAFDREVYQKLDIHIDPFPEYCIDDFHIILSFLENGYPNRVFFNYAQNDKGSNSDGGCSTYRNFEVQEKSARWLKNQHPMLVEVVKKTTKTAWPGMKKNAKGENVRMDVRIQWGLAWTHGKGRRNKGVLSF
jgi:hypothetical protein